MADRVLYYSGIASMKGAVLEDSCLDDEKIEALQNE